MGDTINEVATLAGKTTAAVMGLSYTVMSGLCLIAFGLIWYNTNIWYAGLICTPLSVIMLFVTKFLGPIAPLIFIPVFWFISFGNASVPKFEEQQKNMNDFIRNDQVAQDYFYNADGFYEPQRQSGSDDWEYMREYNSSFLSGIEMNGSGASHENAECREAFTRWFDNHRWPKDGRPPLLPRAKTAAWFDSRPTGSALREKMQH